LITAYPGLNKAFFIKNSRSCNTGYRLLAEYFVPTISVVLTLADCNLGSAALNTIIIKYQSFLMPI